MHVEREFWFLFFREAIFDRRRLCRAGKYSGQPVCNNSVALAGVAVFFAATTATFVDGVYTQFLPPIISCMFINVVNEIFFSSESGSMLVSQGHLAMLPSNNTPSE